MFLPSLLLATFQTPLRVCVPLYVWICTEFWSRRHTAETRETIVCFSLSLRIVRCLYVYATVWVWIKRHNMKGCGIAKKKEASFFFFFFREALVTKIKPAVGSLLIPPLSFGSNKSLAIKFFNKRRKKK